jgi:hypothetical protein
MVNTIGEDDSLLTHDKYTARPNTLKNICLAGFAAYYTTTASHNTVYIVFFHFVYHMVCFTILARFSGLSAGMKITGI